MVMIIAANAGLELSVPRAVLRAWMSERCPHTEGWMDLLRPGSGREEKTCSCNYRICTANGGLLRAREKGGLKHRGQRSELSFRSQKSEGPSSQPRGWRP